MAAIESKPAEMPWVWREIGQVPAGEEAADHPLAEGEAEPSAESLVDDAFHTGYDRGFLDGERRATEELETAITSLSRVMEAVREAQDKMLSELEENAAAIAVGVARELVVGDLDAVPETVAELVREAVSSFALDERLLVRLNPADLALITAGGDKIVLGPQDVRWEPDPGIGRGGCLVEGPGKIVDGRLDLALERIYKVLSHG